MSGFCHRVPYKTYFLNNYKYDIFLYKCEDLYYTTTENKHTTVIESKAESKVDTVNGISHIGVFLETQPKELVVEIIGDYKQLITFIPEQYQTDEVFYEIYGKTTQNICKNYPFWIKVLYVHLLIHEKDFALDIIPDNIKTEEFLILAAKTFPCTRFKIRNYNNLSEKTKSELTNINFRYKFL
jgi:hypothetical protein